MGFTAQDVMQLRSRTNAPLMAAKKALTEADGDMDAAIDILRKSGAAKAAKKADREASEGTVAIATAENKAAIISVFCETDFVSSNANFIELADQIAQIALEKGEEAAQEQATSLTQEAVVSLGENIQPGEIKVIESEVLSSYIHQGSQIGVVVALEGGDQSLAQDIAMHIAAANPQVLDPSEVSDEDVAKEKEIWLDQLKRESKEDKAEMILPGKEKKYREEQALLTQDYVKDPSQKVSAILGETKIKTFVRLAI